MLYTSVNFRRWMRLARRVAGWCFLCRKGDLDAAGAGVRAMRRRRFQGADRRKNRAPEVKGTDTSNCPPLLPTTLVTGHHNTGGIRLVAKYNAQPVAEVGQRMDSVPAPRLTGFKASVGRARIAHL